MLKNMDNFMIKYTLDERVRFLYSVRNKLSKFIYKIKENKLISKLNGIEQ